VDPETFTRRPGATVSYEYREEGKPRVVLEIDEAKKRAAISAPLPVGAPSVRHVESPAYGLSGVVWVSRAVCPERAWRSSAPIADHAAAGEGNALREEEHHVGRRGELGEPQEFDPIPV
jgi:hypothetical protein